MNFTHRKIVQGAVFLLALLLTACGGGATGDGKTPAATAPTVSTISPANNATGVATNAAITATFSEAMDAITVSPTTFTLSNGVTGIVTYHERTATFTPSSTSPLTSGTTYTATITTGVKSVAGTAMASPYTWTFTTGATSDTTPPTVSSTSPASGATDVATNAAITATFSEDMNASTVTEPGNFTLSAGSTTVPGTVTYDNNRIATFAPTGGTLANGASYTATITTSVRDTANNAMTSARTWSFTTAGTPIPTVPTVVIAAPKTVTLTQGTTHLFKATVGGTTNTAVTWSATGGTIDNGLYTAPAMPGTYTVTVTTQATPPVSDTATVVVTVVATGTYITPGNVSGDVVVAMDSHTTSPISPFIYGLNVAELSGGAISTWGTYLPKFTFNRYGGNNTTALNWETGYSNCGNDCTGYPNYDHPLYTVNGGADKQPMGPGNAITPRIDFAHARNAAQVITVPILGYVARDTSGPQPIPIARIDAATPAIPDPLHWLEVRATNSDPAGATASPITTDGFVNTDDLAKYLDTYLDTKYTVGRDLNDPLKTVQYQLDNEPDLWPDTHREIRGQFNGNDILVGFEELVNKTAAHAKAVKSVVPKAVVWGGGFATWDALVSLKHVTPQDRPSPPTGYTYYLDYFLKRMNEESTTAGKRLMDVVDLHWYPQGTGGPSAISNNGVAQTPAVINEREQAPRSLWDPDYTENSWVSGAIPSSEETNCKSNGHCPIYLIPRIQARIETFNKGTKIAIGEYSYGRGGDISSTIAHADALGIFGKYGVYAATIWPNSNVWEYRISDDTSCQDEACVATRARRCKLMAIDIYRNYDGNNAKFGDRYIDTAIADATITNRATQSERVTAYASMDANTPNRVVMVAINKADTALDTGLKITHTQAFSTAEVWQVTGSNGGAGGCTSPTRQADIKLPVTNGFNATLPAQSVTVFVLK